MFQGKYQIAHCLFLHLVVLYIHIQGVSKKYSLLKMLTKEELIAIDCSKHVLRAVNITFNDQLMTSVKGITN